MPWVIHDTAAATSMEGWRACTVPVTMASHLEELGHLLGRALDDVRLSKVTSLSLRMASLLTVCGGVASPAR